MIVRRIYGDFNNADPNGNLRMTLKGTQQDLERMGIALEAGLKLIVTDGELEADAVVKFSERENIWVAEVDWSKIRYLDE